MRNKVGLWILGGILSLGAVASSQVPVIGSLVQGFNAHFGNLVAGANGLNLAAWTNEGFTQGSWLSFNNNGGSNGETDFINYHPSLTGGFAWFTPTTSSLGSAVMSLSPSGTLTVSQVAGNASTATTSASTTGNAATSSALNHTPSTCTVTNAFAFGIAADGTPGCATIVGGRTTTVGTTAGSDYATATATVPLSNSSGSITMPDTNYNASCSGVGVTGHPAIQSISKSTTAITVTITNGTNSGAVASTYSEIDCTVTGS